jgi:hypothetical protein
MHGKRVMQSLLSLMFVSAVVLCGVFPVQAEEAAQPQPTPQVQQQVPPPPPAQQQMQQAQTPPPYDYNSIMSPANTVGKTRLFATGALGFGFDSINLGNTNAGDKVSISGGGGLGLGIGAGYGLSKDFDLDFDLGVQVSTLTPAVSNATGSFARSFLLATIKRKIPTSETGQFKVGFGLGLYNNGKLDLDTRDAGGNHEIVKYDRALGLHITGEFERFIGRATSVNIGAKMYFVTYKANSYTVDGASIPTDGLKSEVKNVNGNGLDFLVGINQYF